MQVVCLSAIYWRTGPECLSLSTYFLCLLKSDLFLKPQLSPVLKRAPELPWYFCFESLVEFLISTSPGGVTRWSLEEGLVSSTRLQATLGLGVSVNFISPAIHPSPPPYSFSSLEHSCLHGTPVPCLTYSVAPHCPE